MNSVFPVERQSTLTEKPDLLKGKNEDILMFAAEKAKLMAVLFYGSSKEYSKYLAWTKIKVISVGSMLREDA